MNIKRRKDTYPKNTRCNFILKMFKTKTVKRQQKKEKKMNIKRRKDTYPKHQMECDSKMFKTKTKQKKRQFNSILKMYSRQYLRGRFYT